MTASITKNTVTVQIYGLHDWVNKCIFKQCSKVANDGAEMTSADKPFGIQRATAYMTTN